MASFCSTASDDGELYPAPKHGDHRRCAQVASGDSGEWRGTRSQMSVSPQLRCPPLRSGITGRTSIRDVPSLAANVGVGSGPSRALTALWARCDARARKTSSAQSISNVATNSKRLEVKRFTVVTLSQDASHASVVAKLTSRRPFAPGQSRRVSCGIELELGHHRPGGVGVVALAQGRQHIAERRRVPGHVRFCGRKASRAEGCWKRVPWSGVVRPMSAKVD